MTKTACVNIILQSFSSWFCLLPDSGVNYNTETGMRMTEMIVCC